MELKSYLRILAKNWWIVVLAVAVTVGAAYVLTITQKPIYEARVSYILTLSPSLISDNRGLASAIDILSRQAEIAATYAEVTTSRKVKELTGEVLALDSAQLNSVQVTSKVVSGTNILEIEVSGTEPNLVTAFANAVGDTAANYVRDLYTTYELQLLDPAEQPKRPAKPDLELNLILGLSAGLALGVSLAFLVTYLQEPAINPADFTIISAELDEYRTNQMILQHEVATLEKQIDLARLQLKQIQNLSVSTAQTAKETNATAKTLTNSLDDFRKPQNQRDPDPTPPLEPPEAILLRHLRAKRKIPTG